MKFGNFTSKNRFGNLCKYDFDYQHFENIFPNQMMMGFNDFHYYNYFDKIKNNKKENNKIKVDLEKNSNSNSFASTSESEGKNILLENNNSITEIIKKGLNNISNSVLANREENISLASFYHCNLRNEDNYKYICNIRIKNLYDCYLRKENEKINKII